jgi:hypothetical protein
VKSKKPVKDRLFLLHVPELISSVQVSCPRALVPALQERRVRRLQRARRLQERQHRPASPHQLPEQQREPEWPRAP